MSTSDIDVYSFVCFNCDENFFNFEIAHDESEKFEISINITPGILMCKKPELTRILNKYGCEFEVDEDSKDIAKFSWNEIPSVSAISTFVKEITKIIE